MRRDKFLFCPLFLTKVWQPRHASLLIASDGAVLAYRFRRQGRTIHVLIITRLTNMGRFFQNPTLNYYGDRTNINLMGLLEMVKSIGM